MATAKKRDDDELDDDTEAPAWSVVSNWPTQTKAAARLGISQRRFIALMRDGSLKQYKGADRTIRFSPDELDELRRELESAVDNDDVEREERKTFVEMMRVQTEAIKQRDDAIVKLIDLIDKPLKLVLDSSVRIVEEASKRAEKLEALRDEMIATRESALDARAEREAFILGAKASEERKAETFALVKQTFPKFIEGVEATIGGRSMIAKFAKFAKSLDPAMVSFLLDSDALNEEQRKLLKDLIPADVIAKAEAAKKAAESEES